MRGLVLAGLGDSLKPQHPTPNYLLLVNKYLCFHRGKTITIEAATSYEASRKAAKEFKAKRPWDVTVVLVESCGSAVTHEPQALTP